jgi:hypothetical protein
MAKRPVFCYTVFRSDRASVNKTRGGGVLIALSSRVRSHKHRYDLEYCDECVWIEIPTLDGLNLLIGNHYFPPDVKPENITNYFRFLENCLDTHNFRAIMVGDINALSECPHTHSSSSTVFDLETYFYQLQRLQSCKRGAAA